MHDDGITRFSIKPFPAGKRLNGRTLACRYLNANAVESFLASARRSTLLTSRELRVPFRVMAVAMDTVMGSDLMARGSVPFVCVIIITRLASGI